ncbi:hypothetical protein EGW08_012263 [Elysia chlorotica]|uniref:Uncharacterized protein n=1 Tax=Elysia chlorotica TaxID=188477 RepID=A0A3S1BG23_ELYCH|nr:hypothetical protein EGW08_012263 [Elysia chlorotica]
MDNLSREKRMVSLALGKQLPTVEDTVNTKVSKWEDLETDYSNDDDCDFIPSSVESSSDSNISRVIPLQFIQQSTPQQNRHVEACNTSDSKENLAVANQEDKAVTNAEDAALTVANAEDMTVSKNKTKPKRICKFCNEWQTHLKRHLIRRHPLEDEVKDALKLPAKDQMQAFASIRKNGIYKQNVVLAEKRKELIRERRQGTSATLMCSGCKGFYDKKTIFKHKRICCKSESINPVAVDIQVPSENALSLELSTEFTEQVLNRFRRDEVGQLCRSDFLTLLLGKKAWAKSAKKERHVVMSEMRLYANLIIAFRQQSENQNVSGTDILDYSQFDTLEKAILQLSDSSGHSKNGLKVRLGFLLKRAVKVIRGYYITQGKFKEENAMTKFLDALHLQWDFIFYNAQVQCEARREGLRKPSAMPDNEDVEALRSYAITEMNLMLDRPYDLWDDSLFVKLRNLIVCRITCSQEWGTSTANFKGMG